MSKDKLASENFWSDEFIADMTEAEAEELWQLWSLNDRLYDAARDEIASTFGYDKSQLTDRQRDHIETEAEKLFFGEGSLQLFEQNPQLAIYQKKWSELDTQRDAAEKRIEFRIKNDGETKELDLTSKMAPVMIEAVKKFRELGADTDQIIQFLEDFTEEMDNL